MDEFAAHLIISNDAFIAATRASELFSALSADVADETSKEIIDASSSKADDAISAIDSSMSAARTFSLFGGKKAVWLRNVNFLSDGALGKSESLEKKLEELVEFLSGLRADEVAFVINASPVDKRKKFFKQIQSAAEVEDLSFKDPAGGCLAFVKAKAKEIGISLGDGAAEALVAMVAADSRMALSELLKLANYVNYARPLTEEDVFCMVPIFGAGDFFDISNAFSSGDLQACLSSLRRYFFANKNASARPIIATLQKKNSLLIQIRSMLDSKLPLRARGGVDDAREKFSDSYSFSLNDKNSFNVFSQNPWYLSNKLIPEAEKFSLKRLLDFQLYFIDAFRALIDRGGDDEAVMRDLFVRCLSK